MHVMVIVTAASVLRCYWLLRKKLMQYDTKPLADPALIKPDEKVTSLHGCGADARAAVEQVCVAAEGTVRRRRHQHKDTEATHHTQSAAKGWAVLHCMHS